MVREHNNKIGQRVKASRTGRERVWKKEGADRMCNHPSSPQAYRDIHRLKKENEDDNSQRERKSDGRVAGCPWDTREGRGESASKRKEYEEESESELSHVSPGYVKTRKQTQRHVERP